MSEKSDKNKIQNFVKKYMNGDNDEITPYSFQKKELELLYLNLKSSIQGQDDVIMQYIKNFHAFLYRNKNNENNLGAYWQFGPSGTGKNLITQEIAKTLGFETHILDVSSFYYAEFGTLFGTTSGFNFGEDSMIEGIYQKAEQNNGKMILIFDEIEKGKIGDNSNFSTFLTSIMNMLHNKEMEVKNTKKTINFQNFIFVFNSNLGFDDFEEESLGQRKIGFDIGDDNYTKIEKKKHKITAEEIKKRFKNDYKISVSVFNRLFRADNIFLFNPITIDEAKKFFESEFIKMINDLKNSMNLKKEFDIKDYEHYIENYDILKGYRGVKDIVHNFIRSSIINENIKMKWDLKIQKRKKIFK